FVRTPEGMPLAPSAWALPGVRPGPRFVRTCPYDRRMDFEFSAEQEAFRRVVREFAEAEIAPHTTEWDRDHVFPVDVVRSMGELGLFGLVFPEEYGGSGADFTTLCIAIEEIGRVDQSLGI